MRFLSVIFILFMSCCIFTQTVNAQSFREKVANLETPSLIKESGRWQCKAAFYQHTAVITSVVGIAFVAISQGQKGPIIAGGCLGLLAGVFQIMSWKYINRSGICLEVAGGNLAVKF